MPDQCSPYTASASKGPMRRVRGRPRDHRNRSLQISRHDISCLSLPADTCIGRPHGYERRGCPTASCEGEFGLDGRDSVHAWVTVRSHREPPDPAVLRTPKRVLVMGWSASVIGVPSQHVGMCTGWVACGDHHGPGAGSAARPHRFGRCRSGYQAVATHQGL